MEKIKVNSLGFEENNDFIDYYKKLERVNEIYFNAQRWEGLKYGMGMLFPALIYSMIASATILPLFIGYILVSPILVLETFWLAESCVKKFSKHKDKGIAKFILDLVKEYYKFIDNRVMAKTSKKMKKENIDNVIDKNIESLELLSQFMKLKDIAIDIKPHVLLGTGKIDEDEKFNFYNTVLTINDQKVITPQELSNYDINEAIENFRTGVEAIGEINNLDEWKQEGKEYISKVIMDDKPYANEQTINVDVENLFTNEQNLEKYIEAYEKLHQELADADIYDLYHYKEIYFDKDNKLETKKNKFADDYFIKADDKGRQLTFKKKDKKDGI